MIYKGNLDYLKQELLKLHDSLHNRTNKDIHSRLLNLAKYAVLPEVTQEFISTMTTSRKLWKCRNCGRSLDSTEIQHTANQLLCFYCDGETYNPFK